VFEINHLDDRKAVSGPVSRAQRGALQNLFSLGMVLSLRAAVDYTRLIEKSSSQRADQKANTLALLKPAQLRRTTEAFNTHYRVRRAAGAGTYRSDRQRGDCQRSSRRRPVGTAPVLRLLPDHAHERHPARLSRHKNYPVKTFQAEDGSAPSAQPSARAARSGSPAPGPGRGAQSRRSGSPS
jgi:hypothetical protein